MTQDQEYILPLCCSTNRSGGCLWLRIHCVAALVVMQESAMELTLGGECGRLWIGLVAQAHHTCCSRLSVGQKVRERPAAGTLMPADV